MEKKTPLYETHVKYKGKIVPFGGYLLPVQYESGVIAEHMAVRKAAGLFDVSHMGEILLKGKDAFSNLQRLMSNDFSNMEKYQARYSPMLNFEGGFVDDLIVYKEDDETYFIVVNASNKDKDFEWISSNIKGEVTAEDISSGIAQLALQGPKSYEILKKITDEKYIPEKYYHAIFNAYISDMKCIISRTGYTGEDGFEIYLDAAFGETLWEMLMEAGKEYGLIPCGLGARDTLRLEAAMPLYGHEMDDSITPFETGLGFAVKMNKPDFIGKEALLKKGEPTITRVGLDVTGRGIVREHTDIYLGDKKIGHSTSGTHCPYLGRPVAMALIDKKYADLGTELEAEVRGRKIACQVTALPFYKKH
ncbi:MAG: glycine cleavage system aminomethyltransferase GcvT [Lachnospiraceae bacterium]|nr:glycine cleavage system aminomethyltransferase GcvT [Lachnospiraceae bacterium]